jgi:membrane protein CcdC involved in cytochrome C biogenesis
MDLNHVPHVLIVVGSLAGAAVMLAWRVRESRRPVTIRAILAPPLGMSTGFLMFLAPAPRIPLIWAGTAFVFGAVFLSVPLVLSSRLARDGQDVVMERSKAFLWILLVLFAIRFLAREWIEQRVTMAQTGAIFFVLAFGMIVRWRAGMLLDYVRLRDGAAREGGPGAQGALR